MLGQHGDVRGMILTSICVIRIGVPWTKRLKDMDVVSMSVSIGWID